MTIKQTRNAPIPKTLTSAPSAPAANPTNVAKNSAAHETSATGRTGPATGQQVQQQQPPASAPPGWHQDQLGKPKATPQDTSAKAMFQSKETVAALNSRRNSVFTTRASQGTPKGVEANPAEIASASGSLHAMAKKPSKDYTQLATNHQAQLSAWVEQGRDPVIQASSQAGGVCSVMVNEWARSGLLGADAEGAFRALLHSGSYGHFVELQKEGEFVQNQVVKNEQFLVADDLAKNHMTLNDRRTLQQQSAARDRNNTIPNLTTRDVTPQGATISSHLDFGFALSRVVRNEFPPGNTSAFFKLGINDSNGDSGHAIGIKASRLPGGTVEFSVLDPNTGEFTQIPQDRFAGFWKDHMAQTYDNAYQNGTWSLLHVT
ncbi:YopT-type cysteine protease domain-containing protein [Archangium lansingense]|uniref:YopT-type cysteine protease domain-containing protein n=1 Tax=Archangium lansingense TaxID=2995310 RepID=A0ABT4A8P3_9BACT|nr:YopT-type cysteine protease domain-containing protein [Archangium lansinium]MCY1078033.1 YopT-type cysteine protease domain-containing protein [Archangium lansinium]